MFSKIVTHFIAPRSLSILKPSTYLKHAKPQLLVSFRTYCNPPAASSGTDIVSDGNRPIRQEPGRVIARFIPYEFAKFFHKKTGISGFYTFCGTVGTFLVSKEIYVLEHEFYTGLGMTVFCVLAVKFTGPMLANFLDNEVDKLENSFNKGRVRQKEVLDEMIADELECQQDMELQLKLADAKRESIELQIEAVKRQRQHQVYEEVLKRLKYHLKVQYINTAYQHTNIIMWIQNAIIKAIDDKFQDTYMDMCFNEINELAKKVASP